MANKSPTAKDTSQKKSLNGTKPAPKRIQKRQTASFDISSGTSDRISNDSGKDKIIEEVMSPTKTTINLFESLANQYILYEKPFVEKGENAEKLEVLKSKLAPDVEERITDISNNGHVSDATSGPIAAKSEASYASNGQISNNIDDTTLASDIASQNHIPESNREDLCLEQGAYLKPNGEFDNNIVPSDEFSLNNSFINYKSSPIPKEVSNAIQDAMSGLEGKSSNEVTINDLKVKIIEILNTPFSAEELDLASAYELDKMHVENLRELGEKLKMNADEKIVPPIKPRELSLGELTRPSDVLIKKPYQKQASKANNIDKKTVETFYNATGISVPSKQAKSKVNYSVTDLTGESLIIGKSCNNTPRSSPKSVYKTPTFQQDKAFMDYNTEKELIEMAMREDKEVVTSKKINVIYLEDKEALNRNPSRGIFRRIFLCGC